GTSAVSPAAPLKPGAAAQAADDPTALEQQSVSAKATGADPRMNEQSANGWKLGGVLIAALVGSGIVAIWLGVRSRNC
ncbi:MAG: hypothetical protein ACPHJ3_05910, partial [Rubripirellula sp.]